MTEGLDAQSSRGVAEFDPRSAVPDAEQALARRS
jgi:hypothetical protein